MARALVDWVDARAWARIPPSPYRPNERNAKRAFRVLDELVAEMAAALERLDRPIYDAMIARAKETRGG